ncbi:MAG: hypothetical protein Q4B07_00005, partial [Clostridia bacterium]|nr:hypothetical protein [Clostridia bacterium]
MSKLTKIFFGRRTLAIVVAIVMMLQLLPLATLADDVLDVDASTEDVVAVDPAAGAIGVDTVIDKQAEESATTDDPEIQENLVNSENLENPDDPENP